MNIRVESFQTKFVCSIYIPFTIIFPREDMYAIFLNTFETLCIFFLFITTTELIPNLHGDKNFLDRNLDLDLDAIQTM